MFRLKTLTMAMTAAALMAGCSSLQPSKDMALEIRPVQETTHGLSNVKALYQLGRYYQGQMRYELALDSYRQALALQPQDTDVLTAVGVVHASLGQHDEALQALKTAATLQPDSPQMLNNLGYIHWLRKEKQESMAAYRQALRLDPMNERTRQNLRMVMGDAVNQPLAVAMAAEEEKIEKQDSPASYTVRTASNAVSLREVSPQVYELALPSRMVPATAQAVAPAVALAATKNDSAVPQDKLANGQKAVRPPAASKEILSKPQGDSSTGKSAIEPVAARQAPQSKPQDGAGIGVKAAVAPIAAKSAAIEVLNGNGVKGIAKELARNLSGQGHAIASVGNYRHHNEARTRIEYAPGYAEQARELSSVLPSATRLSVSKAMQGDAKIRLVIGKDFIGGSAAVKDLAKSPLGDGKFGVANGNGVNGMARKVAQYLASHGYKTASVYNLKPFNKTLTQIEYRKGYEAQALKLGSLLPVKVAYSESTRMRGDVRLVLGHDIKQNMASWTPWLNKIHLAEAGKASSL
jgi:tetratricopeptide (TPR) repeat protein